MSNNVVTPSEFFNPSTQAANLVLIACPGAEELTRLIDGHLKDWAKEVGIEKDTFIIDCDCPRFQNGDAKGLVKASVRGDDIFFVVDPGNYSLTYNLFGYENHLSPDDHFANLKRLIQALSVWRPSASPHGSRKSGLCCGSAGAAEHGCYQYHHL